MPAVQVGCPECGSKRTAVVLTRRLDDDSLVRRRKCGGCGHRWYTHQQPEVSISNYSIAWSHDNIKTLEFGEVPARTA